jgi:hypothetical protein
MKKGRNYRKEYDNYQGSEVQKKNRAKRNAARAKMAKAGKVHKGDGMDVDHKHMLINGGGNDVGNLSVKTKSNNRSFPRTSAGKPRSK